MNRINKISVDALGYNFIPEKYLPKGKDEYYLRNLQNRSGIQYRNLTAHETEILVRNRNTSDNWRNILVASSFNPHLVRNCKFFGLVRIGKLESIYLEFHSIRHAVGLYNSTIISCDFGDNVVLDNVHYLSHYIVGSEVIMVNIDEMANTNYSKFGNGIIKEGESEDIRIWMELCNENGGRKVIPFSGMLPGDAFLWSRYRTDAKLQRKFKEFTEKQIEPKRGFYGKVGDRTVIKSCKIIKDVWIGSDAYLKGANKLKNLTINSEPERKSQIGEGCELVNGIIGYGCKAFYGVKAVRFVMSSHSQLKYGARLINSFLGNNATISCCEVLNSLIFPSHEQHHNNSFLCAALIMGQSNLAAGATIGSNHNSRSNDGEIIANRGFWPGLCVSLKHNSKFASFTMMAKGDYPNEINLKFPFSLVSNNVSDDTLNIMPAFWFMYNMYALERNADKYRTRDNRTKKIQRLEFHYLAPDTINEIIVGMQLLEWSVGLAYGAKYQKQLSKQQAIKLGKNLLDANDKVVADLEVLAQHTENSKRKVIILKSQEAYNAYSEMLKLYVYEAAIQCVQLKTLDKKAFRLWKNMQGDFTHWENIGGQLIPTEAVKQLIKDIKSGRVNSWQDVRSFYITQGQQYSVAQLQHAAKIASNHFDIDFETLTPRTLTEIIAFVTQTKSKINRLVVDSRAKDYTNPYKQMVYESIAEMNIVIGSLEENSFIKQHIKNTNASIATLRKII